jgi:F-type H+-transporting ATPase subunit epsilon
VLHLQIVTPKGPKVDTKAEAVVVPGVCGELGILPGHLPLLSAVRPGTLSYQTDGKTHRVAISRGYLQVDEGEQVLVLVRASQDATEIDAQACREQADRAQANIDAWDRSTCTVEGAPDPDYQALEDELAWSQARLAVVESRSAS